MNTLEFWKQVQEDFDNYVYCKYLCVASPLFKKVFRTEEGLSESVALKEAFLRETGESIHEKGIKTGSYSYPLFACYFDSYERIIRENFITWNIQRLSQK